jgi:hypothetical protein
MNCKLHISAIILFCFIYTGIHAQNSIQKYSSDSNHRELAVKAFQLAVDNGFSDPNLDHQEIQDRLEAGSYNEDYENIPGTIGSHFPDPWTQGPDFDFLGLYPTTKIPYGELTDLSSGWYRGFMHGFDPAQGFLWPGASESTVDWASSIYNSFTWDNAVALYNNGEWQKAYQCLGHVLHLLMDLSVPSHVKVVDHGASLISENSGTFLDPDIAKLIVDEYEMALNGGIELPDQSGIYLIPNLLSVFRNALDSSKATNIPEFPFWNSYFDSLAKYTYNHPVVNQYYAGPDTDGNFGYTKDSDGLMVSPIEYGKTLPGPIGGRWTQFEIYCTVKIDISIVSTIPKNSMIEMCNDLVPKAVEFGAGLIQHFIKISTGIEENGNKPDLFILRQNYPNPFNPSTTIEFTLPKSEFVTLKVYNIIGEEITTVVSKKLQAGNHTYQFDGSDLASGIYLYRIVIDSYGEVGDPARRTGEFQDVKKMVLIK